MIEKQHLNIKINGKSFSALSGQTVAAALIAAGIQSLRHTSKGQPRGLFCGMGVCFECLVTIDGIPNQRACMIFTRPGMKIYTNGHEND